MFSSTTKENANNVKNDAKSTIYSAKRDIEEAVDRETHGNRDTVTDFANEAGRKVRTYFEAANDHIGDVADRVNDEIKSNPLRSSLIALGAGFILGILMSR